MTKISKAAAAIAAAVVLTAIPAGCGNDKNENSSLGAFSTVSIAWEMPQADELRKNIIGSWGRLGEVMHEFYDDNTCIIGGMFGDYEITSGGSLVLTSVGGTRTEYVYGDDHAENYWQLDGDTLTVNGNQFTRIEDETQDEAKK